MQGKFSLFRYNPQPFKISFEGLRDIIECRAFILNVNDLQSLPPHLISQVLQGVNPEHRAKNHS